jgi:hypothetical protein
MRVRMIYIKWLRIFLNLLQIVDRGSAPVSNAEVLAHITTLEAKYEKENRKDKIPDEIKTVIRDVLLP